MASPPRKPAKGEVLAALKKIASDKRAITVHGRCQKHFRENYYDLEDACELVRSASLAELYESEPDDNPKRSDCWIAKLQLTDEDGYEWYVKVVLILPDMKSGYFLSFRPWG